MNALDRIGDLFLDEVYFFGSSLFSSFWLIVSWCIDLVLHLSARVLLVSSSFLFRFMATP